MRGPLVALCLLATAVAPGCGAATQAHEASSNAGTYVHRDARHDVEGWPAHRMPHNAKADVTRLRIVHDESAVDVFVRLRSASMAGLSWRAFSVLLKTPADRYGAVLTPHGPHQDLSLQDIDTNQPVTCDLGIVRRGKVYQLTIPRSCLDDPEWIRAGVAVATIPSSSSGTQPSDNALSDDWRDAQSTQVRGRLIYRPLTPRIPGPG